MSLLKKLKMTVNFLFTCRPISIMGGIVYNSFRSFFDIQKKTVLFQSSNGLSFSGNPYYLAKYLLEDDKYKEFKIVIIYGKSPNFKVKKLIASSRAVFCRINSLKYIYWLSVAEYLVNDVTFPAFFSRKNGQKYLNTWHGTPLKTLGKRIAYDPFDLSNAQRNFLHSTHILAPNFHTESVLTKDYMIEHLWNGVILRNGYPRNDIFFSQKKTMDEFPESGKYNIVFMPTWRCYLSDADEKAEFVNEKYEDVFSYLEYALPDEIRLWVNLHPYVQKRLKLSTYKKIKSFPRGIEVYDFVSRCDALVTDYSSVIFDFSVTSKPIILYAFDENGYSKGRGFCLDYSSLPFPCVKTQEDLLEEVLKIKSAKFIPTGQYKDFVKKYCPYDNGFNTEEICSTFFRDDLEVDVEVCSCPLKKNILIFTGPFLNNGITSSLKNLLKNLDKDRYNYYLWIDKSAAEKHAKDYFLGLDDEIGYIVSQYYLSLGAFDSLIFVLIYLFNTKLSLNIKILNTFIKNEYKRIFSDVNFDVMIHFSGYDSLPALIMALSHAKKVIYMHNDMVLERNTKKNYDARIIDLVYREADVIAAVRDGVASSYCSNVMDVSSKVTFVPNCQNIDCSLLAKEDLSSTLIKSCGKQLADEVLQALSVEGVFRFINLGRFSPEKGHLRLIDAFEAVSEKCPVSQLYIIGGYGNCYDEIVERRSRSYVSNNIFILQDLKNPFPLLGQMDAMVLSSFYEGLPMVIFESLALGIPIISTDIPGPSEFLKNRYGHVVENTVSGLIGGMMAAINGEIPTYSFDFDEYNRQAVEKFYSLIDDV